MKRVSRSRVDHQIIMGALIGINEFPKYRTKTRGTANANFRKADGPLNASLEVALVRYHLHLFTLNFILNNFPSQLLDIRC